VPLLYKRRRHEFDKAAYGDDTFGGVVQEAGLAAEGSVDVDGLAAVALEVGVVLWVCLCGCVCGCVGVCVGVWVCGCVGVWVCGCVDVWMCGCVKVVRVVSCELRSGRDEGIEG
jgi:hypothetical protein